MTPEKARERMLAVLSRMPVNPAMIAMFTRYFAALDERDGGSIVHCFCRQISDRHCGQPCCSMSLACVATMWWPSSAHQ